jgi:hypothetical protein
MDSQGRAKEGSFPVVHFARRVIRTEIYFSRGREVRAEAQVNV